MQMLNGKGQAQMGVLLILALVVLGGIFLLGKGSQSTVGPSAGNQPPVTAAANLVTCQLAPTYAPISYDLIAKSSPLTDLDVNVYQLLGGTGSVTGAVPQGYVLWADGKYRKYWSTIQSGSTGTVIPGPSTDHSIVLQDTVAGRTNPSTYGAFLSDTYEPTCGTYNRTYYVPTLGSISFVVHNALDDTNISSTTSLAIGSGGTGDFKITEREAVAKQWSSNPFASIQANKGDLWVFQYDDLNFQVPTITTLQAAQVGVPLGFSPNSDANGNGRVAYDIKLNKAYPQFGLVGNVNALADTDSATFTLHVPAISGKNPGTEKNIDAWHYMYQFVQNTDKGTFEWGATDPVTGGTVVTAQYVRLYVS